jgi:predicted  nucleic acid-binding Zn-ribbon protein
MPACDGPDSTTASIEEARRLLMASQLSGPTDATGASERQANYAQALQVLRPASQEGSARQRAAAQMLIAQAQAGQGAILTDAALELERQAAGEASRLRSVFENLVVGLRAQAAAGSSGATTADQQQIATQVRQIEAERSELATRVNALRSEMEQIRQQISAAEAAAAEARSREAALRARLLESVGETRTETAIAAVEAQREAAGHERERAVLDSRLSVLQPETQQLEREIGSLETRIELLNASRQRMQNLDQAMRDSAGDDSRTATQSAQTLMNELAALDAMRQSDLADAYSAAIGALEQAVGAARQASGVSGDARSVAMISLGSHQQNLADLFAARARGQERYAMFLSRLLDADPALPQASTIRQYLERVRTDAAALREQARAAYEEAGAAYGRAQARGDLRERIDALVAALAEPQPDPVDDAGQFDESLDQQDPADPGADPGADPDAGA